MKRVLLSLVLVFCLVGIGYSGVMTSAVNVGGSWNVNPLGFDEKDSKNLAQISAELKRLNRNIEKLMIKESK